MNPQLAIAMILGLSASVTDLRSRNIPNWIPVAGLLAGIAWHVYRSGWWGLGTALLGAVSGFVVFLVFYLMGGMGGGDVKLMAGFGALLGSRALFYASLYTAIIGGIWAVVALAWRKYRRSSSQQGSTDESIPYAPAIALGAWFAILGRV